MDHIKEIKNKIAVKYVKNKSVSPLQGLLKASLVPLDLFDRELPDKGVFLDLGCGEGILANQVASLRPQCRIIGIDRDDTRLNMAKNNAADNAEFVQGDIFELDGELENLAAVILNDVVHHQHYGRHQTLIFDALRRLKPGGLLILKEVDKLDRADAGMTRFFDSRLYPDDILCFRTKAEWLDMMARLAVHDVSVHRVKHPWPASRTVFLARRPEVVNDPVAMAVQIGEENLACSGRETVVFVTGATGFLGRHLCCKLLDEGFEGKSTRLIYLSRNPERRPVRLESAIPLYGDLDDLPVLKDALRGVDYVFNLAAEVKLTKGVDIWRNNYHGTLSLLKGLDGINIRRFVHASTMGAVDRMPSDDCRNPLTEKTTPNPLSEYGRTKLDSEKAVQNSGIPYSILRVPWAYGSGMTPDTHVRFLTDGVAKGKLFSRFAFPGKVSILSASDTAEAFRIIAVNKQAENEIYFASDGHPISLSELFQRYASVIGKGHVMLPIPGFLVGILRRLRRYFPLQIQALTNDVLKVDPEKLFSLGFIPRKSLREGLYELARDQGNLPEQVFEKKRRPVSIVTGAAGGIGTALVRKLHDEGHSLLLVDIDKDSLKELSDSLALSYIEVDLSKPDATEVIERHLESKGLYIDWMINNAGIGLRGNLEDIDPHQLQKLIEINCSAVASLSQLFVRLARKSCCGTLINIGSSSGFQPLPYMAAYAASKAFVQSFTLALIGELKNKSGVRIVLIDPSGTDTNFQVKAGVKKNPDEKLLSPDRLAGEIIRSVYRGKVETVIGFNGRLMALLARFMPRNIQARLWARLMIKLR